MTVLFGSQTGTAEGLARKVAAEAGKHGFAASALDMAEYPREQLKNEQALLVVTSTYGDGDPPDSAKGFWEFLRNGGAPQLENLNYSVLALGDTNYAKFCEFGKSVDTRLEELGARRILPRVDCDVDFDESFHQWLTGVLPALGASGGSVPAPAVEAPAGFSRKNPFPARLLTNRKLNGPGSDKDTRHFEILLEGSGLSYEVGDALGVQPANCPELVDGILRLIGSSDESLREALVKDREVTRIPSALLQIAGVPDSYADGRDVLDLLTDHPVARLEPAKFVGMLKKLQPRLYSISPSPKAHPGQVHLTVAAVRYESQGRGRKGVCSTFLADRVGESDHLPVFVHTNKNFRPPTDGSRPMIMVGPGTGVAPFRAFLEERRATGAAGKNWLFFGDQHAASDFLYREELEAMKTSGTLTRLETAFSRDQKEKVYVQHRMLEHAAELFTWLEEGAGFYVCGDAKRMAKDVDLALHEVIEQAGGRSPEQAAEYVAKLQSGKRYQRDVY
ncbi:MAG: sulfite reductase subunit alpha [Verrucomicrobiales bacterium]|nr:sulfite reductase subunit alpha [Verrucomicrobiales bacterium]